MWASQQLETVGDVIPLPSVRWEGAATRIGDTADAVFRAVPIASLVLSGEHACHGVELDAAGGQPAEFAVNGVIAGWTEALQLMNVGSKWRLTIPYELAYGEQGAGGAIGPYSTLVFDVELLEIVA